MTGDLYTERDDALVQSSLNRTFDELHRMSEESFRRWAKSLWEEIATIWQQTGAPPFWGFTDDEIASQFGLLGRDDTSNLLVVDEGQSDCLLTNSKIGSACRAFFPNMAQTKDLNSGRGFSLRDYFTEPKNFEAFLNRVRRNLKGDGYYIFSPVVSMQSFGWEIFHREPLAKLTEEPIEVEGTYFLSGHPTAIATIQKPDGPYIFTRLMPSVLTGRECIECYHQWLADGLDHGWDFWLEARTDKKLSEDKSRREPPLTVSKSQLEDLCKKGVLPERYLRDIEFVAKDPKTRRQRSFSFDEAKPSQRFRIRGYYKDDKIFPQGFRAFKALVLGATNFPSSVAKYLYQRFTDDVKGQDEIIVYDPSAGFGGRLLGALAAGTDRQLHYVGTDPNPDNWLDADVSRYEALARFYRRNVCQAKQTTYEFFKRGSEAIRYERRFKKYRGKLDLVFTSPPYYRAEGYSDDKNQSHVKFDTYDKWRDGFLRPTLETAVEWLKPGRPLILNIADTIIDGHYVPLEDDSKAILAELRMKYEAKLKLVLAHSPGANRIHPDGFPETKNFCMIGGNYRKYEPIFIFRKPV